jgi:sodium-dependent phosphate cotransporter
MIATKNITKPQPAAENTKINKLISKSTIPLSVPFLLTGYLISICIFVQTLDVASQDFFRNLVSCLSNPFIGLFIGLMLVSILQRTLLAVMIVMVVASAGLLSASQAVPVIIGINIGITFTHHLISLGRTSKRREFRRFIAVATLHSFFSICVALLIFPLEYFFKLPSQTVTFLAVNLKPANTTGLSPLALPLTTFLINIFQQYPLIMSGISGVLFVVCFRLFSERMKKIFEKKLLKQDGTIFFDKPISTLLWDGGITACTIQSGIMTVSLIIPLIIRKKVSLGRIFPFVAGAYLGASLIPLLIALLLLNEAATEVALGHFLFVAFGVLIFFPFSGLRYIPVLLSRKLATLTIRNRTIGLLYVLVVFFIIPFLLILFTK